MTVVCRARRQGRLILMERMVRRRLARDDNNVKMRRYEKGAAVE